MRIGIRLITFACAALLVLAFASAASSGVASTQIVIQGGPGFLTETLDGTVTGSVATAPGTNPGDYSVAANGSIAYADHGAGDVTGGVWIVNPAQPPIELDSSPQDSDVAISPDGSKVAFTRADPATDSSDVYVANADGSGSTLIASGGGNNNLSSLAFSPDGGTIAYECGGANNPDGTGIGCGPTATGTYATGGLMLMNAGGGDKRMVLTYVGGTQGDSVAWSPDGRSIAMSGCVTVISGDEQSCDPPQVFVYNSDGSDLLMGNEPARQVTDENSLGLLDPQFTLDGSAILFEKIVDNQWALFSIDRGGTNEQPVSAGSGGGSFAVVPPETGGGPLATVTVGQLPPGPDGPVVVASWLPSCRGYLAETAAGAFTGCIPGHGRIGFYSNTSIAVASGDTIVYSDLSAGPAGADGPIWLSRPNAAPVELDSSVYDFEPSISSDGSKVAFGREDPATGGSDIYTINADGSDLKLVASGTRTNLVYMSNPTLSPDGRAVAYDCSSIDKSYTEDNEFCGPLFDGTFRAGGLMLMNADGSDKREIVNRAGENISWSPDGLWLATEGVGGQIFAYRTDGSDLFMGGQPSRRITHRTDPSNPASDPQFSPDGSQIMFSTNYADDGSSVLGLSTDVIDRDGTNQHEVYLAPLDVGLGIPGLFVPGAGGGGPSATVPPTETPVPNVKTLSYGGAKKRLAVRHLTAKIARRNYSARVGRGRVISQSPGANKLASLGQNGGTVKLVLSRGRRSAKNR
jgi:Tol biopolymer transport system component